MQGAVSTFIESSAAVVVLTLLLLLLLLLLQVPKVTVIIGGSFGAGNYGELGPCCSVDCTLPAR
jgi:hypothetical protein